MFKLSRYWNKFAFFVMGLGRKMIWDQTGKNKDIIKCYSCESAKEILTYIR